MKAYSAYLILIVLIMGCGGQNTSSSQATSGNAGSMARFNLSGDYLYTVTGNELNVLDVSDSSNPVRASRTRLNFDVETIFSYKSNLYLGATTGMYIYDISIATQPTKISDFTHALSCDPVIVVDDVAYITLNTNSSCFRRTQGRSRLEIVDVKDPANPVLIRAVDMWAPEGLAIGNDKLFICDGNDGLKVFDINKTDNNVSVNVLITSLETKRDVNCYDLIARDFTLYVSNRSEIKQFDYTSNPLSNYAIIK